MEHDGVQLVDYDVALQPLHHEDSLLNCVSSFCIQVFIIVVIIFHLFSLVKRVDLLVRCVNNSPSLKLVLAIKNGLSQNII